MQEILYPPGRKIQAHTVLSTPLFPIDFGQGGVRLVQKNAHILLCPAAHRSKPAAAAGRHRLLRVHIRQDRSGRGRVAAAGAVRWGTCHDRRSCRCAHGYHVPNRRGIGKRQAGAYKMDPFRLFHLQHCVQRRGSRDAVFLCPLGCGKLDRRSPYPWGGSSAGSLSSGELPVRSHDRLLHRRQPDRYPGSGGGSRAGLRYDPDLRGAEVVGRQRSRKSLYGGGMRQRRRRVSYLKPTGPASAAGASTRR